MSKIDKGTYYEEYVCNYINNSNTYSNNNLLAYLWKDVPAFILFNAKLIDDINDCRINRDTCKNYIHDIGIDIIQLNTETNKISFIQCKNYEGSLSITDLSGYFAIMAQSEHYDKEGIIYTSNNKYSYNLIKVCKGNTHKFIHLPIENNIIIPKNIFVPYDYQLECVNKFNEYYSNNNSKSGILQLPCGCGKTFTSYLISQNYNIIIIISPLKQHTEQNILNFKKYSKNENFKSILVDSDGTRNINYIIEKIKNNNNIVIGSTYKSCDIIIEIIKKYPNAFLIIDEFHNLSYNNIFNSEDNINKIIKSENKKLYMSATPRIYDLEENNNNFNIEELLGKVIYKMTFEYAIQKNYISNYELYLPVYDKDNYNELLKQIKLNNNDILLIKKVLYYFESIKILGKLKTIIYFNSHDDIDIFIKCFNDVNNYYNYKYNIDSIICSDIKNSRIKKLDNFNNSNEISVLCSVSILDECIDIPSCDSIYITYNCISKIRIIQRISRALRKLGNKVAKILIWTENISNINPIISAIKEIDNNIISKIKYIKYNNKNLSLDEHKNIQKYNKEINIKILEDLVNNENINNIKLKDFKTLEFIKDRQFFNFNEIVELLSTKKNHLKRMLIVNFKITEDYTEEKVLVKNKNRGANYVSNIIITKDCFIKLFLLSQTNNAKKIKKYIYSEETLSLFNLPVI